VVLAHPEVRAMIQRSSMLRLSFAASAAVVVAAVFGFTGCGNHPFYNNVPCGNTVCGPGEGCLNGACVCSDPGLVSCMTGCYDLSADPMHCGTCGHTCGQGTCVSGHCQCAQGQADCGMGVGCADLSSDPMACGNCGHDCGGGMCVSGTCQCGTGQVTCPGQGCATLATDRQNCGTCGHRCMGGVQCVSGVCQ
jgi:hypothetical protein